MRRRHGEAAQPDRFGDSRVPDVGVGVLGAEGSQEEPVDDGSRGAVNQRSPVPDSRMPNSVPLRAIVVTTLEGAMPDAASTTSFAAAITTLSMKWSFESMKR